MKISQSLTQKLGMSQQQVQSLNILEMSAESLEAMIYKEEMENPFFEVSPHGKTQDNQKAQLEWLSSGTRSPSLLSFENDVAHLQHETTDCNTLGEILWQQINWNTYSFDMQKTLAQLISCLDNHGFITETPEELAETLKVDKNMILNGLKVLRKLEPAGVATQNVGHSIAVRLEQEGITSKKLLEIPMQHLEALAKGHFGVVAEKVGIPALEVKKLFQYIGKFSPYPWTQEDSREVGYVIPDVICKETEEGIKIDINDSWMGTIGLNDYYCKMAAKSEDLALSEYALRKINAAKFVIRCIEKRRSTLRAVTEFIALEQSDFIINGGALKPLNMKVVAEKLNMHPSTVSRAIKNKYLQCRRGCFEMANLLSVAVVQHNDDEPLEVGRGEVLDLLRDIVENENKLKPLSDQSIVEKMGEKGVKVSRRTIAKYRNLLGIAGTFQRKII